METYKVIFSEEKEGIFAYAWVQNPAIEEDFVYLNKHEPLMLKAIDEEKRIVVAPVLIPNKPIYRFDEKTKKEYNIIFPEETILMAEKHFFKNGFQNNSNLEHTNHFFDNVTVFESWIKEDDTHDKSIKYGFDLPNGTLFFKMSIDNDELREKIISGEVKAISIEGDFKLEKINLTNNMSLKEQLKEVLVELGLAKPDEKIKLGSAKTSDGNLIEFEGGELVENSAVWVTDAEGNKQPIADGEYTLENGKVITVSNSVCVSVADVPAEMKTEEVEMADEKYNALESKINEIASAFEDFKVSMSKQISEGLVKLSETIEAKQSEEKEDEEEDPKPATKLKKEKSWDEMTALERFRATKNNN